MTSYYIMVRDHGGDPEEWRYNCRFDTEEQTGKEALWYRIRGYDVMILSIESYVGAYFGAPFVTSYPEVVALYTEGETHP